MIGPYIIDSVFDICDQEDSDQGLTLAEIKENDCVDFLGNTFGLLHNQIEEDFEAIDKNGDGLVSKEEGVNAYLTFDRLDSNNDDKTVDDDFSKLSILLYTNCVDNPTEFDGIDEDFSDDDMDKLKDDIENTSFDATRPTKIIAHGYREDASDFCSWFIELYRTNSRSDCNFNIICVNWEKYSDNDPEVYVRAANNAVEVGKIIGEKIVKEVLVDRLNQDPSKIHAIGHSLGAHLVGYIGRKFQAVQISTNTFTTCKWWNLLSCYSNAAAEVQKIGRITGLDPANLLFDDDSDHEDDRLKKEDADFVDVIHTNSGNSLDGCFGLSSQMGHVDFYPNGGSFMPGCTDELPNFAQSIKDDFILFFSTMTSSDLEILSNIMISQCSHNMVQRYYQDSIKNRDDSSNFLSKRCDSYEKFENDDCYGDTLQMGEALDITAAKAAQGNYFLDTNAYDDDKTPYSYSTT